jgi:hypothetical protein
LSGVTFQPRTGQNLVLAAGLSERLTVGKTLSLVFSVNTNAQPVIVLGRLQPLNRWGSRRRR